MKMTTQKLQYSLFFSLIVLFAGLGYAKSYDSIEVPSFMEGVKEEPGQTGPYLNYQGGVVLNRSLEKLPEGKIEDFIKNLWRLYKEDRKEEFKKLLTKGALVQLEELGKETFDKEWKVLNGKQKAVLNFYFPKDKGHVVHWTIGNIPRAVFIVKAGKGLKIGAFEGRSDDASFHNRSLYFTYLPLKAEKAQITKALDPSREEFTLIAETTSKRPILHVFKKESGFWELKVRIRDNEQGKGRFDDVALKDNLVKVKFSQGHFTGDRAELLVMRSNFPMKSYPVELEENGNMIIE